MWRGSHCRKVSAGGRGRGWGGVPGDLSLLQREWAHLHQGSWSPGSFPHAPSPGTFSVDLSPLSSRNSHRARWAILFLARFLKGTFNSFIDLLQGLISYGKPSVSLGIWSPSLLSLV